MVQKNIIKKPKIIVISGPTAVGKSYLAIELAKKFNGEVVSCDSMQIYKGMDIGTGKITKNEMSDIKHHLVDIVEPSKSYSAAEFCNDSKKCIIDILSRKKLPIIVGGTGLFIQSLLFGFKFGEADKNENIRKKYEDYLIVNGPQKLHDILESKDKKAADSINVNKTRAVIRALEVIDSTGKLFSEQHDIESSFDYLQIALFDERESLYNRINNRVDTMFDSGLLYEVKQLIKSTPKDSQAMQAIGYKEIIDALDGKYTIEMAKDLIKQHSRNYAKRQLTWLKNKTQSMWFKPEEKDKIVSVVSNFIKEE